MRPLDDEILFGWDPTPGIVSVWADQEGQALVYRRVNDGIRWERRRFRPFLFAASLDDLQHLGHALADERSPDAAQAEVSFHELEGEPGAYRYLLGAASGRALSRAILAGASRR